VKQQEHVMGRKPEVRFFASRGGYFCQSKGRQVKLGDGPPDGKDDGPNGPFYNAALAKFRMIFEMDCAEAKGQDIVPVRVIWEQYRAWLRDYRSAGTLDIREQAWSLFVTRFGDRPVYTLTHADVYDWIRSMREWRTHATNHYQMRWTDGTVRTALNSLSACFGWAVKSGLIKKNPITGMERPRRRSRTDSTVLEPHEWELIKTKTKGQALEFLKVLEATGARPGEIANATAANYDDQLEAIVHKSQHDDDYSHKLARHGKDRVILLSGEALDIIKRRVVKYPKGPLFGGTTRSNRGRDVAVLQLWNANDIAAMVARVRAKTGLEHLIAYSFRHSFATSWIRQGRSVEMLAELIGTSPEIIRKHYCHLFRFKADMRKALQEFRGNAVEQPGAPVVLVVEDGQMSVVLPNDGSSVEMTC
jgi:integrase